MEVLKLVNICKSFGGVSALNGVSLSVKKGEIYGIIGPNGAGKTTLFNVATASVRPDSGNVVVNDEDITGLPPHAVTKRGMARTFQNIRLFNRMTLQENVMVGMHCRTGSGVLRSVLRTSGQRSEEREAKIRAMELLDFVGLSKYFGKKAGILSYGQQRKLEIARALATSASILLLDEPVAGMNESETEDVYHLLTAIAYRGITIVLIEHDMGLVMNLCGRVAVLDFGELIAAGTPSEIKVHPLVIEAYLGSERG
ncbi:MAG: ABC transporter ATP-binding protein [Nitrospirae bacterium]|nr:ABC transporter ATP-binding protein [Nitrospirota bacterium]